MSFERHVSSMEAMEMVKAWRSGMEGWDKDAAKWRRWRKTPTVTVLFCSFWKGKDKRYGGIFLVKVFF